MRLIPSWSELHKGGTTSHVTSFERSDNKVKSISEELPKGLVWVGSETTGVNIKLCKIQDNLKNKG